MNVVHLFQTVRNFKFEWTDDIIVALAVLLLKVVFTIEHLDLQNLNFETGRLKAEI